MARIKKAAGKREATQIIDGIEYMTNDSVLRTLGYDGPVGIGDLSLAELEQAAVVLEGVR
jgi:hypothetical protein